MENTEKYYTPSISEFCVGFEYQTNSMAIYMGLNENGVWSKTLTVGVDDFLDETIADIGWALEHDESPSVRVKYLDQEDIESLGFKFTGKAIDIWFEKEGNFNIGSWTSYKIKMQYGLHDNRLKINAVDALDEHCLFQGTIKNKSELVKLLKQLGLT
jgi:hypothetical protein